MADEEVLETEHSTEGAEAEVAEPDSAEVADGEQAELEEETPPEPEKPAESDEPNDLARLTRELEELRAERQRVAPLIEFAQRALQARQQAPQQQAAPSGPDPVQEAFRLLWEGGDDNAEAFKALPANVRREAALRFQTAQQRELERIANPDAYHARALEPLVQQAVRQALSGFAPVLQDVALARFNAAYPDLANDAGYAEVAALTDRGMPVDLAVEHVRLLRGQAGAAADRKSKSAADADSRAVLEARRGKAAGKPDRLGNAKPIKRSGYTYEDALRDVAEATRGE